MTAEELINHMIPPLKTTDDAHKAVIWMEELRCNQLPVVDERKFVGLLSEEMILEENEMNRLVGDYEFLCPKCAVKQGSHFYEVLKLASDHNVQTVGVIDELENYAGAITVQDTITAFAQSAAVQLPGGIIVLSVNQIDYSLSQISRLIEENNAKILSSSVKIDDLDPGKLRVTIKINRLELNHIAATLERFGYRIIARFQETNIQDEERERLDMLLKYLDI
jgi:predicted transcriptional regulator